MDGVDPSTRPLFALIGVALFVAGCSQIQPAGEPLPFSMFDSPLIAGAVPQEESPKRPTPQKEEATEDTDKPQRETVEHEPDTHETAPEPSDDAPPTLAANRSTASNSSSASSTQAASSQEKGSGSKAARYVATIYELNGVKLPLGTRDDIAAMYRHCREADAVFQSEKPAAGDMAFYHNVRDANGDGRNNDWYTHVGLVERVKSSGRVEILAYRDGEVRKITMDLEHPDASKTRHGHVANSRLRQKHEGDPPFTQYLAGQLFAGYCSLLGDKSELLVVDNWQPGMTIEAPEN